MWYTAKPHARNRKIVPVVSVGPVIVAEYWKGMIEHKKNKGEECFVFVF